MRCLECVERESIDDLGHSRLFGAVWPAWRARWPPSLPSALACALPTTSIPPRLHSSSSPTMPIAPITGKLRKRFWLDLSVALGMGVSAGYAFWSVNVVFRHALPA